MILNFLLYVLFFVIYKNGGKIRRHDVFYLLKFESDIKEPSNNKPKFTITCYTGALFKYNLN